MVPRNSTRKAPQQALPVSRAKLLLINEDRVDLDYYHAVLQGLGFTVRSCHCYRDGVDCLDSEAFDFIIVAQGSPAFEGRCVLEHAMGVDRKLPVLILSRCFNMGCYLDAMQMGAVDYLVEPLGVEELVRVITTHLLPRSAEA